jgi:hypothetical protein
MLKRLSNEEFARFVHELSLPPFSCDPQRSILLCFKKLGEGLHEEFHVFFLLESPSEQDDE